MLVKGAPDRYYIRYIKDNLVFSVDYMLDHLSHIHNICLRAKWYFAAKQCF